MKYVMIAIVILICGIITVWAIDAVEENNFPKALLGFSISSACVFWIYTVQPVTGLASICILIFIILTSTASI